MGSGSGKRKISAFVDIEAAVDREEIEDESDDEEAYIDNDDDDDIGLEDTIASHSRLQRAILEARDDFGLEDEVDGGDQRLSQEEEDLEELGAEAQAALDRRNRRLDWVGERVPRMIPDSERPTASQSMFFEVKCAKPAHEEELAFRIQNTPVLVQNQPFFDLPRAVIARNDMPGRIFLEMATFEAARRLAAAIPDLIPSSVKQLTVDEMLDALTVRRTSVPDLPLWVRIRSPSKYRGDIALVVKNDGSNETAPPCYFVVVPRLSPDLVTKSKRCIRPPQQRLLDLPNLRGARFIGSTRGDSYEYRGQTFSPQGFWIATYGDVEVVYNTYTMPTKQELHLFRDCDESLFPRQLHFEAVTLVSNAQIREHDRVRVVQGDFVGLVAVVLQANERELEVFIVSQEYVTTLARRDVRIHFLPGDEVCVNSAEYPDLPGWVIEANSVSVTVTNVSRNLEVKVSPQDVKFYTAPRSAALRIVSKPIPRWTTVHKRLKMVEHRPDGTKVRAVRIVRAVVDLKHDPYNIYHGRRVMVTKGVYKAYKGYIRETMLVGRAIVELDAVTQNQKRVTLPIPYLTLLEPDDMTAQHTLTTEVPSRHAFPQSSSSGASQAIPSGEDPQPAVQGATPMWTPEQQEEYQTPHAPTIPSWLSEAVYANHRIKLVKAGAAHEAMEFDRAISDATGALSTEEVSVRVYSWGANENRTQVVKIADIRAVIPCMKGELVLPTFGEHAGQVLRVFQYGEEMCVLRPPGVWKKPKKGAKEIEYPTNTLAVVLPPH